ncbi:predicted protein [Botrytis cinerea T4]|uniref:Uncharacterized protein n=1 Tax=Botryotinia fuckeliana (strain T4) TaxID=999810 RepID=G2XSB8_BOTF4|nr:predicted protein [Botrytis cinerea T4]
MSLQLQEFRVTMTQCRFNGRHNFLSNLAVDYLAFLELSTEAGYLEESRDFFFLIQGLLACKMIKAVSAEIDGSPSQLSKFLTNSCFND